MIGDESENINIGRPILFPDFCFKKYLESLFANSSTRNIYQGRSVPGLAHGKMYKRYTFEASCPSLRSRFGVLKQKTTSHEEK